MKPILAALALLFAGAGISGETLIWSDEFNEGTQPNPDVWSYDLGNGNNGWGNFELQSYTDDPANVAIADGNLKIAVQKTGSGSNAEFTSARIRTQDKVTFTYATLEARIKVPDLEDGLWPAFWTLGNNFSQVGWPFCGELDVMEMGNSAAITQGVVNRRVGSTAHWENNGQLAQYGLSLDAPQDLSDDFHIYRMEWTPDAVTTYLDGEFIWAIDITPGSCTDCEEFHQPHFMILNMAVGGTYTGRTFASAITASTPAEMLVDYVRIYDNGFTIVEGTGVVEEEPSPGPGYSGSWYNVDQSGHGFSAEFGMLDDGSPFAIIYWYIYDADGNPIFFFGSGVPDETGVDIEFVSPVGMLFGQFDPATVDRPIAGNARFEFTDADNGTFTYTPSQFSIDTWGHSAITELPIVRLFAVPQLGGTR